MPQLYGLFTEVSIPTFRVGDRDEYGCKYTFSEDVMKVVTEGIGYVRIEMDGHTVLVATDQLIQAIHCATGK